MRLRLPLRRGEFEKPRWASRRNCSTHCPGRMVVHAGGLATSLGSVQFCIACRSHLRQQHQHGIWASRQRSILFFGTGSLTRLHSAYGKQWRCMFLGSMD